ncbi:hypothetical protein EON66_02760, partial [archaeon]
MDGTAPELTREQKQAFNLHVRGAKRWEEEGDLVRALQEYAAARVLWPANPQLIKKMGKLQRKLGAVKVDDETVLGGSTSPEHQREHTDKPVVGDVSPSALRSLPLPSATWQADVANNAMCLPGGFHLPLDLYNKLFDYQRAGVAWMWSLHSRCPFSAGAFIVDEAMRVHTSGAPKICGGILADDMGLGKTVQVVAFVTGLFHSEMATCILILAPSSVIPVWEAEFAAWAPELRVKLFHGAAKQRERTLASVVTKGGVILTTYGMLTNNPDILGAPIPPPTRGPRPPKKGTNNKERHGTATDSGAQSFGVEDEDAEVDAESALWPLACDASASARGAPLKLRTPAGLPLGTRVEWDAVICDEGHKLKNPSTQVAKAAACLPSSFRLLLTGTPIQNELAELWALCDFFAQRELLGSRRAFNADFGDAILASRDRFATEEEIADGARASRALAALV